MMLSPEAELWLYRLLTYGTEGMPHDEYCEVDCSEGKAAQIHQQLYHERGPEGKYVEYFTETDTWVITPAGIEYLKRRNL
jgi:hypothetical protein